MAKNYLYQAKDSVTGTVYHWTTVTPGSGYPGPNTATEVALVAEHGNTAGVSSVVNNAGDGLAPSTSAATAGRLLGFSGGAKTGAWVNPVAARVYNVGNGYGMYGSIADAITAINAGALPTAGDRALIQVWPGVWGSSAPYVMPEYVTIRGVSQYDVVLRNPDTNLFHVNSNTVFANFSVDGVNNDAVAAFDNNASGAANVTVQDVAMSGLTHCHQRFFNLAGAVWNGIFVRRCVVTSRRLDGYTNEFNGGTLRNTSVYIEDCNFDNYDLTGVGGCVRFTAGNNNRIMRSRFRGANWWRGLYLANNGQSSMITRIYQSFFTNDGFGGAEIGVDGESGWTYHLYNSYAPNSTGAATRVSVNSFPT